MMQETFWAGVPLGLAAVLCLGCSPPSSQPTAQPASAPAATVPAVASVDDERPHRVWVDAIEDEAGRLAQSYPEATIRLLALDVETGEVIASAGPVTEPHPVGSTIKPLTIAAALEAGLSADQKLDCTGPARVGENEVRDYAPHGELSVAEGLAVSSNVCIVRILEQLDWTPVHATLRTLLPIAARDEDQRLDAVADMIGFRIRVSTTDLARAYATLVGGGVQPVTGTRVISPETARVLREMLEGAVSGPRGTGDEAAIEGHVIVGKTGTTDEPRTALFVGVVPEPGAERVLAVVVENAPTDASGGSAAAPAFKRIALAVMAGAQRGHTP